MEIFILLIFIVIFVTKSNSRSNSTTDNNDIHVNNYNRFMYEDDDLNLENRESSFDVCDYADRFDGYGINFNRGCDSDCGCD